MANMEPNISVTSPPRTPKKLRKQPSVSVPPEQKDADMCLKNVKVKRLPEYGDLPSRQRGTLGGFRALCDVDTESEYMRKTAVDQPCVLTRVTKKMGLGIYHRKKDAEPSLRSVGKEHDDEDGDVFHPSPPSPTLQLTKTNTGTQSLPEVETGMFAGFHFDLGDEEKRIPPVQHVASTEISRLWAEEEKPMTSLHKVISKESLYEDPHTSSLEEEVTSLWVDDKPSLGSETDSSAEGLAAGYRDLLPPLPKSAPVSRNTSHAKAIVRPSTAPIPQPPTFKLGPPPPLPGHIPKPLHKVKAVHTLRHHEDIIKQESSSDSLPPMTLPCVLPFTPPHPPYLIPSPAETPSPNEPAWVMMATQVEKRSPRLSYASRPPPPSSKENAKDKQTFPSPSSSPPAARKHSHSRHHSLHVQFRPPTPPRSSERKRSTATTATATATHARTVSEPLNDNENEKSGGGVRPKRSQSELLPPRLSRPSRVPTRGRPSLVRRNAGFAGWVELGSPGGEGGEEGGGAEGEGRGKMEFVVEWMPAPAEPGDGDEDDGGIEDEDEHAVEVEKGDIGLVGVPHVGVGLVTPPRTPPRSTEKERERNSSASKSFLLPSVVLTQRSYTPPDDDSAAGRQQRRLEHAQPITVSPARPVTVTVRHSPKQSLSRRHDRHDSKEDDDVFVLVGRNGERRRSVRSRKEREKRYGIVVPRRSQDSGYGNGCVLGSSPTRSQPWLEEEMGEMTGWV